MAGVTIADLIRRDGREPGGVPRKSAFLPSLQAAVPRRPGTKLVTTLPKGSVAKFYDGRLWIASKERPLVAMTLDQLREQVKRQLPVENFSLVGPWSRA